MDSCIFCKIIQGELPSYKVWENDKYLAFLTTNPHAEGHTLFIPKAHTDYLYDLSQEDLKDLFAATKPIANLLKEKLHPSTGKIGVVVAGLAVPHIHVHLVPMSSESDLDQSASHQATPEELESTLKKLKS